MTKYCNDCGSELSFTETPKLTHYGRLDCKKCNKFFGWLKNPNKKDMRTKTSRFDIKQIMKEHNFNGAPFCFFCLRNETELGINEVITRDHILELDKGGIDDITNIQLLCTACHKLKNWSRLYCNWHLK